jgi:hypothetical protein
MMALIPREIRREVNFIAHRLALKNEARVREQMLADLMYRLVSGGSKMEMGRVF